MPWWNSTSKDSVDTRAGASADLPIDLVAFNAGEDISVPTSKGSMFSTTKVTQSKSMKRSQTSPDMSEQATGTKRTKGTDQTDVKLEHSESFDSDSFEMTEEHENSKVSVDKLRAIISRQSEEIQEFQTELRTAMVKQLEHTELDEAERTIKSLRVQISIQYDGIQHLKSQLSVKEVQYSSDVLELDQANCDLKQELLEMTQKHDDLQTSVSDLEALNSARREEIESWTHEFFTTEQAYEKLKNAMRDEVAAATISLQALTETQSDQIKQLEKDEQAAEAKYKKLEQSRDKLKDKLESARFSGTKRAVRHRRAYKRLKHDTNTVRAELEAVTAERDELNARLGEIEAQIDETEDDFPDEVADEDEPENCLVVICVDISGNGRWVLDQIKHAYTAILMFLKTRWGSHARVAVVIHGWHEYEVSDPREIDESLFYFVEINMKWEPEEQSNYCDDDYTFCLSTAQDFLSREEASQKAVVMIGPGTANTEDDAELDKAIAYLRSNHIPAHSVIIRPHEYPRGELDPSSYPVASLTELIGGRVEDQETYCFALEDLLG
ncbi:hypothetical protein BJ166DRAFT_603093 [Pestalotiopsis sp. NC0098]|nr:hypothetical protein BJ166DRAFT_603093 [Pestalotiopsis sp. NC0098]